MSNTPALRFLFERHSLLRPSLFLLPTPTRLASVPLRQLRYCAPAAYPTSLSRTFELNAGGPSMRHQESSSLSPGRAPKRRRISATAPHEGTSETMATVAQTASQTPQPLATIQLTPLENTLKELLLDVAKYIRERAIAAGASEADTPHMVLRFTGGWVRDKLLGVDSHDIDVGISSMTGYQFGMALKDYLDIPANLEKYKRNHPNGEMKEAFVSLHKIEANPEKSKHLETVTTKIFGLDIDLVNLRKETYTDDSRNPQMEFGTAEEDALRRDATINALFYNLNESKVEDFTGRGFSDMRDKIIRTPLEPYQTFRDDPLRVLRLIRFASRLGYRIDPNTERAMQNSDISAALKLKISKERVGAELEKMLKGPDPRGALRFIDRLGLYHTIFANHQDDVSADTSSWSLAYNALGSLLRPEGPSKTTLDKVRDFLMRSPLESYHAWMIAALAPWSSVPPRVANGPKAKPFPPRAAEVARDSLRSDNKMISVLGDAAASWRSIIDVKSSLLEGRMKGTAPEVRQQIGLYIKSWKKDWRLCILLAILQEIMRGGELLPGAVYPRDLSLTEMEELRTAARETLQRRDSSIIPEERLDSRNVPENLDLLWHNVSSYQAKDTTTTCENLLVAQAFLTRRSSKSLSESEENAVNNLYRWASGLALPSAVFATTEVESSDVDKSETIRENKSQLELAVFVLNALDSLLRIQKSAHAMDVITALASFTSEQDSWTTRDTYMESRRILESFATNAHGEAESSFWSLVERILKERIKPVFAKTKNPAITAQGRKNFHPVPLPRFDASIIDPATKPWKISDVYATTVLAWVIAQYQAKDRPHLEAHFPLLVPPILALVDDDSVAYKTRGCILLTQLLTPIRESRSDILQRTNLASVFEDAVRPCLLSLPSITPEDDAIKLLGVAYPALLSLLQTNYHTTTPRSAVNANRDKYISSVTRTLRENLISSFHHISSTNRTSTSSFASFPYPRLSTLLVDQMYPLLLELGIHTTKYLQEIVPLLYSTLSNPFGTAYPPLLLSAVAVTRAVILNAHPRLWRWRGEILGALCSCWLRVVEEEGEIAERAVKGRSTAEDQETNTALTQLKKELRGVVYLLRFALENPARADGDAGQLEAKAAIRKELQELVDSDEALADLLLADIDPNDADFFGVDP
ncbi:hypothetical protein CNMCM6936_009027 [Aspergillus lentulus]|uniref:CCA tRNA nucleotidyltransferase, mitochondrial n=2 Tax=Aspergillus lentulus TaxID=293939 RepID=A0AAN5YGK8_ASPLE|nr:hypothetical protein CNMCM6069_007970 [Aspergillus lentulus]KAF4164533.1 hypothetical protein CNMCM6936_009027 [Aspergillus lentulus]KAF4201077.1 hypothetical protein CNMCM8927_002060 [Aspergillus lentulus]